MRDRLKRLLEDKNMTQAEFADYIGVGRPSITHIMTGRDKNSQTVVSNTLLHFPEINPMWLLKGEGEMYRENVARTVVEHVAAEPQRQSEIQESTQPSVQKTAAPADIQASLFPEEEVSEAPQPAVPVQPQVVAQPAAPVQQAVPVQPETAPQPVITQQPITNNPQPVQPQVVAQPAAPVQQAVPVQPETAPQPVITQQPITNNQQPITNNPQPITYNQQPITNTPQPVQPQAAAEVKEVKKEKKLKKIVFFYDDRSFEEFLPTEE